jgi:hypothetical protein
VKRPDHGGIEVFVTDGVSSSWFRTGAPYDDHDVGCGIYVDRLSDSGQEAASGGVPADIVYGQPGELVSVDGFD